MDLLEPAHPNAAHPNAAHPNAAHPNAAAPGVGADLATFAISALWPLAAGLLLLDAYVLLGMLGAMVALICLTIAAATWKGANGAMVPDNPRTTQVVGLAVVAAFLGLLTWSLVT